MRRKRFIAWHDGEDGKPSDPLLEDLIAEGDRSEPVPPAEKGRVVILTSGTTGHAQGRPAQAARVARPGRRRCSRRSR